MTLSLPTLGSSLALALLLTASTGAQQSETDVQKAIEGIQQEFDLEFREAMKVADGLPKEEATLLYRDFFEGVAPEFSARLAELARQHRGTPAAFDAWSRVISLAARSDMRSEQGSALLDEALRTLSTEHIQSEALAGLATNMRYTASTLGEERVLTTLEGIVARSPHRAVKASALYTQARVLGDERPDGDPRLAKAKLLLADLRQNFGDVAFNDEGSYAAAAASFLFALENLALGKPCPDFSAVDAEGASFKLSDYKGKVVLIDFWGFW